MAKTRPLSRLPAPSASSTSARAAQLPTSPQLRSPSRAATSAAGSMMAWSTAMDGMAGYSRSTAACQPTEAAASAIHSRRPWISGA